LIIVSSLGFGSYALDFPHSSYSISLYVFHSLLKLYTSPYCIRQSLINLLAHYTKGTLFLTAYRHSNFINFPHSTSSLSVINSSFLIRMAPLTSNHLYIILLFIFYHFRSPLLTTFLLIFFFLCYLDVSIHRSSLSTFFYLIPYHLISYSYITPSHFPSRIPYLFFIYSLLHSHILSYLCLFFPLMPFSHNK